MKPMGLGISLLYFGIPALLFVFGFWVLMPWFINLGIMPYYAYMLGLGIPLVILSLASILWLKLEGREINWDSIKDRFRLKRMDGKAWLWSLGALLVGSVIGFGLVSQFSSWLIAQGVIPIPDSIPAFMSPKTLTEPMTVYNEATGGLRGNWLPFIGMAITLFFNIVGEEFWWRGLNAAGTGIWKMDVGHPRCDVGILPHFQVVGCIEPSTDHLVACVCMQSAQEHHAWHRYPFDNERHRVDPALIGNPRCDGIKQKDEIIKPAVSLKKHSRDILSV